MKTCIDDKTFEALKRGDERALSAYFKIFYHLLTVVSWKITANECESQQIAADALLKMFLIRDTIESCKHSVNILFKTTTNLSIDYLRHKKYISNEEKQFLMDWGEADELNVQLDVALLGRLTGSLNNLPLRTKEVIKCIEIYKLSYARTAEIMHTTVKNIENIRAYGFKKMRTDFNVK